MVGLMKSLALRKAKINAVGVVGLVENMVSGNAQRPGDIVKSYSGKTIEILNTDAEGRLVLADALTFTEEKFKPRFIIDLATLTGAIIVCLGSEFAGLFSNDDKLSNQIYKAGETEEKFGGLCIKSAKTNEFKKHRRAKYKLCRWSWFSFYGSIFTKIYFKQNTLGSFRYCWYGFFKIWRCFKFWRSNRIWCEIIK